MTPPPDSLAFGSRNHLQAGEFCQVTLGFSLEVSGEEETTEKKIAEDFELADLRIFFFNSYNRSLLSFKNSEV